MYAWLALHLCNRGRLLSVRPAPTLFNHLYASLHRAFGHTRPASVPGLSVGLPPSPRLGLRPKPHFQKLYRFIDSLKTTVAYPQRWFFILLYVFENQPFRLRNTHQYNRSDNSKHYLRQHIRPVIKQAVKTRLVYGKAVPQLSE